METMLQKDFGSAWEQCHGIMQSRCSSMSDVLREMYPFLMKMKLPAECQCFLLEKLADIEYNLASGTSESIALAGVLGAMQVVKESLTQKRPIGQLMKC
jgi:replication factor C subunit 3/5